jgi:hypothetical protein
MRFRIEACWDRRKARAASRFSGASALMVTTSKARPRYIRLIATSSGNSVTPGPHQVAQAFTSRSLLEALWTASPRPAASAEASATSSCIHRFCPSAIQPRFSDHLMEQPKTFVFSTGTGLPASSASIASRVSWVLA